VSTQPIAVPISQLLLYSILYELAQYSENGRDSEDENDGTIEIPFEDLLNKH